MKLGVVAAVAFSASCTSEPMTEQGMDMAKPSVDMNESADMKMCPNRCSTYTLYGSIGTTKYTIFDPLVGKQYEKTITISDDGSSINREVTFNPTIPYQIIFNRVSAGEEGIFFSAAGSDKYLVFGRESSIGTLKIGEIINEGSYTVKLTGVQKHNLTAFAIVEISDNGTVVKSEAMEQYTDKDVTISDGCGAKVIRLHAYKVNADLIATESNAQIAFVNSRWVLSSPDGIKSKLTINSAPQNADALVIGDNSGILGYNLSYNKGTQFTVCE